VSLREFMAYGSTLVALLCLIKVYGVSRYSTTTTAALVVTAPAEVVLGTMAIYVYPTMSVLTYGTIWAAVVLRGRIPRPARPAMLAVVVITALVTPVEFHLVGLGVVGGSLGMEYLLHRSARRTSGICRDLCRRGYRLLCGRTVVYLGGAVLVLGFVNTLESPWVSAEVFVLREPEIVSTQDLGDARGAHSPVHLDAPGAPVVVYPLAEGWDEYTVLAADSRYVMHVAKSNVVGHYTCHENQSQLRGSGPLVYRLIGRRYDSPNSVCEDLKDVLLARRSATATRREPEPRTDAAERRAERAERAEEPAGLATGGDRQEGESGR
jgi:hypothetical protein